MAGALNQIAALPVREKTLSAQLSDLRAYVLDPLSAAVAATFFSDSKNAGLALYAGLAVVTPLHAASAFVAVHAARLAAVKTGALQSGVPQQGVLVNALFLALAIATCTTSPLTAILLSALTAPLTVVAALAMRRFLLPWNLPPYVGPYLLVIWTLWYASAYAPVLSLQLPVFDWTGSGGPEAFAKALAHGFSQIFFIMDTRLGLFVAAVLMLAFRRTGLMMVLAGTYAVSAGFLLKSDPWIAHSGILAFPAILAAAALRAGPAPAPWPVCLGAVAAAPVVELAALRAGFFTGVPAFSASYLALMWIIQLSRDSIVRFGAGVWRSQGSK